MPVRWNVACVSQCCSAVWVSSYCCLALFFSPHLCNTALSNTNTKFASKGKHVFFLTQWLKLEEKKITAFLAGSSLWWSFFWLIDRWKKAYAEQQLIDCTVHSEECVSLSPYETAVHAKGQRTGTWEVRSFSTCQAVDSSSVTSTTVSSQLFFLKDLIKRSRAQRLRKQLLGQLEIWVG